MDAPSLIKLDAQPYMQIFVGQCGNAYLFSIVRHIKYNTYELSDFKNTILDDRFCLFQHRRELLNQVWPFPNINHIELFRILIFFSALKNQIKQLACARKICSTTEPHHQLCNIHLCM